MALLDRLISNFPLLADIAAYLHRSVGPIAQGLDQDSEALLEAFKELGDRQWLGLRLGTDYGGQGLSNRDYFLAAALLARYSGALAFLQTQHQSAGGFIATGCNEQLKQGYLPAMVRGQRRVGIGFSHLRRPVPPLRAVPVADGYRLTGEVPWVTGDRLFDEFVGAATLASGEAVFGLLPLRELATSGQITISEPMALAALEVTRTVRVAFDNWLLPSDRVIDIKPTGWIHHSDRQGVLKATSFAFGAAQGAISVMEQALERKNWSQLVPLVESLQAELDQALQHCLDGLMDGATTDAVVNRQRRLRAAAIALAGRCAQAAVATSGGAANGQNHPAQRIYREVLVFTVSGQTPELAGAIVESLAQ
ncbi:acyl-CoA dehydrogenase [filamentous cyanobacterium CCP5]|nr:acyl-CoA dehydrogenase [filamentous cyanobacterium CCP5]